MAHSICESDKSSQLEHIDWGNGYILNCQIIEVIILNQQNLKVKLNNYFTFFAKLISFNLMN